MRAFPPGKMWRRLEKWMGIFFFFFWQGWIYRRESYGTQGNAELFFVQYFVDQVKTLLEPDSNLSLLYQRAISVYVIREGGKIPKICFKAYQWWCSFNSTWVGGHQTSLWKLLTEMSGSLLVDGPVRLLKLTQGLQTTKIMMCSFTNWHE